MPFLNESVHLPRFLDSMAAQTRVPDRLVLVDDGSTDGSAAIAESFAARHPFAVVVRRPPRPPRTDRLAGADELKAFLLGARPAHRALGCGRQARRRPGADPAYDRRNRTPAHPRSGPGDCRVVSRPRCILQTERAGCASTPTTSMARPSSTAGRAGSRSPRCLRCSAGTRLTRSRRECSDGAPRALPRPTAIRYTFARGPPTTGPPAVCAGREAAPTPWAIILCTCCCSRCGTPRVQPVRPAPCTT